MEILSHIMDLPNPEPLCRHLQFLLLRKERTQQDANSKEIVAKKMAASFITSVTFYKTKDNFIVRQLSLLNRGLLLSLATKSGLCRPIGIVTKTDSLVTNHLDWETRNRISTPSLELVAAEQTGKLVTNFCSGLVCSNLLKLVPLSRIFLPWRWRRNLGWNRIYTAAHPRIRYSSGSE